MTQLRIGGVPEHFNLPWHLALEEHAAQRLGIDAQWQDFPDGSGALAAALRDGRLDVAMLLSEGAVAGAAAGGFKIVSVYTESPLLWGIHVPAASSLRSVADIRGARYAISRHGSGSHLMAVVHARQQGWNPDAIEFVTVRNLDGAIDAFAKGAADVFFWEKLMTKPLVDVGKFRRVGEFSAPWPAFVVCASTAALETKADALGALLEAVLESAARLVTSATAPDLIARRYGLERGDVGAWLTTTRWATHVGIDAAAIGGTVAALHELDLLRRDFSAADAVATQPF